MEKAFVISDIHGMYYHLEKILQYWDRKDRLIILGDLVDRGIDSLAVVQKIMNLTKKYDVTFVMGNHDQMLLDYIETPTNYERYFRNGAETTILSFTQDIRIHQRSHEERAKQLTLKCKEEIDFLKTGLLYYQFGKVLFTHAGFWSWRHCWEETSDEQFVWIRDHYKYKNKSGYVNVFGHTPTRLIHSNQSNDIWISEDKTYIGIDGGCAYGGQLNAILINDEGELLQKYHVKEV